MLAKPPEEPPDSKTALGEAKRAGGRGGSLAGEGPAGGAAGLDTEGWGVGGGVGRACQKGHHHVDETIGHLGSHSQAGEGW